MKIRLFIFLVLLPVLGYTQFNDTAYIYTFGGIQDEVCYQAQPTWDHGYVFIGTSNSFGPGTNSIYVVKTDSLCRRQWSNAYGGAQIQEGFSVTPTLDKGFALLGFTNSFGAGGYDVYLIKTDSMGKVLWQKTYGGSDWDFGYSISQTKDSGFVICGLTYSYGEGNGDVYIVRTDKIGDTLWTRAVGGTGYDAGNCLAVHEDSLYYIAGVTTSFGKGDTDMYFIRINNKGTVEWDTTWGSKGSDIASSIKPTADNGFIVYGSTDSIPDSVVGNYNEIILKMDSSGKISWLTIFKALVNHEGVGKYSVEMKNGQYLTVGITNNCGLGSYSMDMQRIAPGGWWQNGACFGGTADNYGYTIAYRNQNNVVFAGASNSPGYTAGLYDFYAIRFTSDSLVSAYILKVHNYTDTLSPASVNNLQNSDASVRVFPNPMDDYASILLQAKVDNRYVFTLYDLSGNRITEIPMMSLSHLQYSIRINRGNLACGNYIYRIMATDYNIIASGKLIVE